MIPWRRKLAHAAPGVIPLIMTLIPHDDPLPLWNLAVVTTVVAALVAIAIRRPQRAPLNSGEHWTRTCLAYALPPLLALFLFPGRAEYAGTILCILAFGDTSAAIGGRMWGDRPLPWNPQKSWAGLLCFIVVAVPAGALAYWGEAHPRVRFAAAALCATSAALPAAIAESYRSRIDDNIRVSIAAFVGVVLAGEWISS